MNLQRYVRTPHLAGSRLQPGDTAEGQLPVASLMYGTQVWEEKLDGSNVGISFSADADICLQSRGHYLGGGWREKQYNLLKCWANRHIDWLFDVLSSRYIMYGEWCYAKHTVFYDRLPHYFFEFDIYDRRDACYLSTAARQRLLNHGRNRAPIISVPIIHVGTLHSEADVRRLIRPSPYKSADWRTVLTAIAGMHGIDPAQARRETDASDLCEGLYLKIEQDDKVIGRYKFVRPDFLQAILHSGSHWAKRPILPNQLAADVDIFA